MMPFSCGLRTVAVLVDTQAAVLAMETATFRQLHELIRCACSLLSSFSSTEIDPWLDLPAPGLKAVLSNLLKYVYALQSPWA